MIAKISAEQRSNNLENYTEKVVELFWRDGWDALTHSAVANELGIKKSSFQGYFPDKKSLGEALRGRILPVVMKQLDTASPESFKKTWIEGMEDRSFTMVVHLLVSNATSESTSDMTVMGV